MSLAQFWLMFALGLVSSIHCVQMCGPIVLSYSLPLAGAVAPRAKLAWAHFWYNLGRVTTYTALGGLAGAAGGAIGLTARLAGIAHGGRIAAGVAMIAAGIYLTGFVRRAELIRIDSPGIAARLRIQPRGELVEHHHLGLTDQGQRDRQPLLLAAGQLAELGVGLARQPEHVHQLTPVGRSPVEGAVKL